MKIRAKVNVVSFADWKPGVGTRPVVQLTLKGYTRGMAVDLTPLEAEELAGWLTEEADRASAEQRETENRKAASNG